MPEITSTPIEVGSRIVWTHEMRGGWGYTERIPGTVVKIAAKRVQIEVGLIKGGTRKVWVKPANLTVVPEVQEKQ